MDFQEWIILKNIFGGRSNGGSNVSVSGGGIDTSKLQVVIPVTKITVPSGGDGTVPMMTPIGLQSGSVYLVVWNNTNYICEAKEVVYQSIPAVAIGNGVAWGGEDTGEPFAIGEIPEEYVSATGGAYGLIVPLDGSTAFEAGGYLVKSAAAGGGGSLPFIMKTFTTPSAVNEFTLLTAEELAAINFDSSQKAFFFMVPTTKLTTSSYDSYVTENFVCNYAISNNGSQDVYGRVAYVEKSGSSFKYTTRNATANPFSGTFDSSLGFVRYVNGAFVFKNVSIDGLYMYGSYFVMAGNLE